jgi:coenzyme PQQ precursor peptide PqqA
MMFRPFRTSVFESNHLEDVTRMTWQKPQFEEVCLNCEINSYAPAEL